MSSRERSRVNRGKRSRKNRGTLNCIRKIAFIGSRCVMFLAGVIGIVSAPMVITAAIFFG